jgi:hypothetical protein
MIRRHFPQITGNGANLKVVRIQGQFSDRFSENFGLESGSYPGVIVIYIKKQVHMHHPDGALTKIFRVIRKQALISADSHHFSLPYGEYRESRTLFFRPVSGAGLSSMNGKATTEQRESTHTVIWLKTR